MQNVTGAAVDGENFYGRDFELKKLSRSMEAFNDVIILSPRRTGKSSLALEFSNRQRKRDWRTVYCDVQHCRSELDFVETLVATIRDEKLPRSLKRKIAEIGKEIRQVAAGVKIGALEITDSGPPEDWKAVAPFLEASLKFLANSDRPFLFVLDELPIFLATLMAQRDGNDRARGVLNWLRRLRSLTRDGFSWLLCGSIGLDSQVEHLRIPGVLADFEIHDVGAMPISEARGLIWELSRNPTTPTAIDRLVVDRIIERVGWAIPCYLQLLYHSLAELAPHLRTQNYPSLEDVDLAYSQLLTVHFTSKFAPWDARLDDSFVDPEDTNRARFLLARVCKHPSGVEIAEIVKERFEVEAPRKFENFERRVGKVLLTLERDGYLDRNGKKWAFRSPILRDYWLRYHT